ncbi:MAG: hypothetical protein RL653_3499 [Pseudomonadota bacterium]
MWVDASGGVPGALLEAQGAAAGRADWEQLLELPDVLVPLAAPGEDGRGVPSLRRGLRALGAASRCPRAVVLLGCAPGEDSLRAPTGGCAARLLGRAPGATSRTFRLAWAALQEGHPVAWCAGDAPPPASPPRVLCLLAEELGVPLAVLGSEGTSLAWELRLLDAAARAGWGGVQAWLATAPAAAGRLDTLASALRPAHLH